MDIRFAEWWEAREIDQRALEDLVAHEYPYYHRLEVFPNNTVVDEKHYKERIRALCVPLKEFCTGNLPFGPD
jgi:hypothetical protein